MERDTFFYLEKDVWHSEKSWLEYTYIKSFYPNSNRIITSELKSGQWKTNVLNMSTPPCTFSLPYLLQLLDCDHLYTTKKLLYIFIVSQLWLTSHPRSTEVLLDT